MITALDQLARLDHEARLAKYPNVPPFAIKKRKFSDAKANDLTRAVARWLELHSCYVVRVQTQGQYRAGVGWTKGTTRRGTADLHAIINGRHCSLEIKIGRDRQSSAQRQTARSVEAAGGQYLVVCNFQSFYDWFARAVQPSLCSN